MFARVRELPGRYWRVTTVLVAFGVVNFPDALLLLRLNEIGFSVLEVILAYVGYNAVYALSSYPGRPTRRPRPPARGVRHRAGVLRDRLRRTRADEDTLRRGC